MKKQIAEDLRQLEASLKHLETAIAWQDLQRAEYRPNSDFPPPDDISPEARLEVGRFWSIAFDIAHELEASSQHAQREAKPQLQRLVQRFQEMAADPRFINL